MKENVHATVKRELTDDDKLKLGVQAGHLAREIDVELIARKEAADKAKKKIDEMKAELAHVHHMLHTGLELIPAQTEMFVDDSEDDVDVVDHEEDDRLERCRNVVKDARERVQSEDDGSDDADDVAEIVAEQHGHEDEELYQRAVELASKPDEPLVTISILRRRLKIGKSKAVRLMAELQRDGVVVPGKQESK